VAAGSNGQAINALTSSQLAVASGASFSTGGGWIQVAHSGGQTYTLQYTGVSGNNLTGITAGNVISGLPTNTVSTGDTVTQVFQVGTGSGGPVGVTDFLGNLIYPTRPYPSMIGYASFQNAFTTTATSNTPLPGAIAPFVIPAGPARPILVTFTGTYFASSAVAGTALQAGAYVGNGLGSGNSISPIVQDKVAVSSDGVNLSLIAAGIAPQTPGSYNSQMLVSQGAAGTLTVGVVYGLTTIVVELI
jgi:hypothetical protein